MLEPEESAAPDTSSVPEMIVESVAVASFAVPFMQAFASKAGEDAYLALRNLIRRFIISRDQVSVLDPSTDTELVYDSPLSDEAIRQLARIPPERLRDRVATWDAHAGTWLITQTAPCLEVAVEDMVPGVDVSAHRDGDPS
jgi:hypothetical protein